MSSRRLLRRRIETFRRLLNKAVSNEVVKVYSAVIAHAELELRGLDDGTPQQ